MSPSRDAELSLRLIVVRKRYSLRRPLPSGESSRTRRAGSTLASSAWPTVAGRVAGQYDMAGVEHADMTGAFCSPATFATPVRWGDRGASEFGFLRLDINEDLFPRKFVVKYIPSLWHMLSLLRGLVVRSLSIHFCLDEGAEDREG